jgi:5-methyltetrahydrofolate--homocysteine methyltransferase
VPLICSHHLSLVGGASRLGDPMDPIRNWLTNGLLITDGAWGTELQRLGLSSGTIPDTWNIAHPERVAVVARSYAEAGSEVILTNTFRANAIAMHGVAAAELDAINRAGVAISRKSAGAALVFASIGPTGKMLASGEVTREQVFSAFMAQAGSLAEADALVIETMSDIEEARLAVHAAKSTGLPVIASFAFETGKNKDRTMTGAQPETVATAMLEAGADCVGANCGVGVESAVNICRRMRSACDLPMWIKPNAGLPTLSGTEICYTTSGDFFASHFSALRDAGADFIGACCGSNPNFVRALVSARSDDGKEGIARL